MNPRYGIFEWYGEPIAEMTVATVEQVRNPATTWVTATLSGWSRSCRAMDVLFAVTGRY